MDSDEFWERPTLVIPSELSVNTRVVSFYRDLAEVRSACDWLLMAVDRREATGIELAARSLCTAFLIVGATIHRAHAPHVSLEEQHEATLAFRACQQDVCHLLVLAREVSTGLADPRLWILLERLREVMGFSDAAKESIDVAKEILS